jgi:hypothetical protein
MKNYGGFKANMEVILFSLSIKFYTQLVSDNKLASFQSMRLKIINGHDQIKSVGS